MSIVNKICLIIAISVAGFTSQAKAQDIAVKTNLLYGGLTLTPNIGTEIGLADQLSLDMRVSYNPWNLEGNANGNKKLVHWMGQAELRYWPCLKFDGHFFGIHGLFSEFNIGKQKLDFLFGKDIRDHRYQGFAAGGGVSYGYHWMLGRHWNLEVNIGLGIVYMNYDKYKCETCGDLVGTEKRLYAMPTKLGISIVYIIK